MKLPIHIRNEKSRKHTSIFFLRSSFLLIPFSRFKFQAFEDSFLNFPSFIFQFHSNHFQSFQLPTFFKSFFLFPIIFPSSFRSRKFSLSSLFTRGFFPSSDLQSLHSLFLLSFSQDSKPVFTPPPFDKRSRVKDEEKVCLEFEFKGAGHHLRLDTFGLVRML